MALFWRLLLAHLIADFPLQTEAVFAVKKEKDWGVLLHATLFGLTAIVLAGPFMRSGAVWASLFFLWLSHIVIDRAKLSLVASGHKDHLAFFLVDQALHIGAAALACLLLNRIPTISAIAVHSAVDVRLTKLAVAYVVSVWVSPLLCYYIRTALGNGTLEFKGQQSAIWRMLGYAERLMLTAMAAQGGRLFFLLPAVFLPRIGLSIFAGQRDFSSWEFILGSAIAIAAGIWVHTLG
jgi:hypothetical protein